MTRIYIPSRGADDWRGFLADPNKHWKFRVGDLAERKLWDSYVAAYEEMLARCSTDVAPWYVIPANKKWFRNLAVSQIVVDTLESMDLKYPKPATDLKSIHFE